MKGIKRIIEIQCRSIGEKDVIARSIEQGESDVAIPVFSKAPKFASRSLSRQSYSDG